MAIKFISNHPDNTDILYIGGKDSVFTGNEKGGYGPFPTYSITRDDISAADGTYLNSKFTINIRGSATLKPEDASSAMVAGQRQSKVAGEQLIKLQSNRQQWPMVGTGKLKIQAYGSADNTTNEIVFNDASIVSIEIPTQTQQSSTNYTEYVFVFEAYNINDQAVPVQLISSAEESWQLTENSGQYCFEGNDFSKDPTKTYTLTHSLSAVGVKRYTTSGLDSDGPAWKQAAKWIQTRIVDEPTSDAIATHINGGADGPKFVPLKMDADSDNNSDFIFNLKTFKAYDHVRQAGMDISGAGYNLTDTWLIALNSEDVVQNVDISMDFSSESSSTTVNINGTITGLSDKSETSELNKYGNEKYIKAKNNLQAILANVFTEAKARYDDLNTTAINVGNDKDPTDKTVFPLRKLENKPLRKSIGHNKNTGTITWSLSYNDENFIGADNTLASRLLAETVDVTYSNNDRLAKPIALIPVIGRSEGPVLQKIPDTGNNNNKETSVTINATLIFNLDNRPEQLVDVAAAEGKGNRTQLENYMASVRGKYCTGCNQNNISARTESWNEQTGEYTTSITHTYN